MGKSVIGFINGLYLQEKRLINHHRHFNQFVETKRQCKNEAKPCPHKVLVFVQTLPEGMSSYLRLTPFFTLEQSATKHCD